jgi:pimeloyl-ACP methyl ester carboxylesterase
VHATRGEGDLEERSLRAIRACLDEIKANGADMSTINTLQNAYDGRALMPAIGYPTNNTLGTSYGTKLGQEVMRSAPEGLRSVIPDSVWLAQVALDDLMGLPIAEGIQSVFDQCAADAKSTAADPNLKNRVWALWAKLDAEVQKLQSCDSAEDHRRPINVAHSGLLCAFVQKCQLRHVATTRRAEPKQTDYRQGTKKPCAPRAAWSLWCEADSIS